MFSYRCQLYSYLKMNIIRSSISRLGRINNITSIPAGNLAIPGNSRLRLFSSWMLPTAAARPTISRCGLLSSQAEGSGMFQQLPWQYQQIRTKKRGTEYQPKNIKRKRTHGWIKRVSTQSGIEVILRRMLKGRQSLTH